MTKLFLIYGLLIVINACVTRGASHGDINGKWKLIGYEFTPKQEFAIEKMTVFVSISENRQIGGKSGCNIFGGDLTVASDHKVKIGSLISTEMACDEITNQFESLFTQTLQNATDYTLENGVLTFSDSKTKDFLRFETAADEKPVGTPATEERLTFFVNKRLVNCDKRTTTKCLQIKNDKDSVWHIMLEPITDFDFKPGRFYKIEVMRERSPNDPGKPSFYLYKLARVIKSVRSEKELYK